ncbi:MAG TPA: amidohydrolase [Candidatus Avilachnospira avistercoris]|nr:amidohydrolase [Candidatus Avilachnospira avistercoris]
MLKDYVLKEHDYIIETRRYLHSHPELSMKEYETAAFIERELDRFGIAHERVGETGVYGWIDGKAEKGSGRALCVALRADIDALPMQDLKSSCPYRSQHEGICHSCGHDGHTATLLAAAKILKEKEQDFCGRIKLFFQQGEEVCGGARLFVEAGLMDDVDRVYSAHVSPRIESGYISLTPGPVNAACDYFKITVLGKSAHVATPDQGVDALYIASQIVVALQSVISRNTSPLDTVVLGVGKLNCGTAYNIVADKAVLEGTTRTFGTESRERTNRRVREIAEATASMYGASVEIEFENHALAVINDEEAVSEVSEVTKELIPEDHIISNMDKSLSADDVAFYIAKAKGMYAYVGTKNVAKDPNTETPYHNGSFDIDEEALLLSCNIYVDYALRCLNGLEVKATEG